MHWRIEDPRIWGPATPRQINTRVPQTRPGVSKWATRWRGPTQERAVPLASLALGSGSAAAKPVFLKSVLENLPERTADMRPARRSGPETVRVPRADRTTVSLLR